MTPPPKPVAGALLILAAALDTAALLVQWGQKRRSTRKAGA